MESAVKLIVITPEALDPREPAILSALFAAGLERCHVRKPAWSAAQLESWLRALPAAWRPRLVLHQHHQLIAALGLGGAHWPDDPTKQRPSVLQPFSPSALPLTSRSCHDLPSLRAALGRYDSVLLGPVFPSLSKPGHGPRNDVSFDELAAVLANRSTLERRTSVLALGGITAGRLPRVRALGFDGVALLGAIWQSANPVGAFEKILGSACVSPAVPGVSPGAETRRDAGPGAREACAPRFPISTHAA